MHDLVKQKKLNQDQKAQILKKPQVQAQIAQLEEQAAQYKKVDSDYQAQLKKSHRFSFGLSAISV